MDLIKSISVKIFFILTAFSSACGIVFAQDFQKIWTLEDCIDYAVRNNITIQKAKLDKSIAEFNYRQSKNNRLPDLNASVSQSFANGSSIDPITSDFVNQSVHSTSFGINSSINLYQGGILRHQAKKSSLLLSQNDLYIADAENNIKLSITEAYIQALYYKEAISISENTAKSSEEELKQAQIKFDNGAIARKDLADVESQYASNQYNIVASKNAYAQQVLALKQLLELEQEVEFGIATPELSDNPYLIPDKQSIYEKAMGILPDIKIYDLTRQTLEKDVDIAKAGFLPTVSLSAGVGTGYTSTQDFNFLKQTDGNLSEQIALSINIPLFSKYENKTNVALAKISIEQNNLDKIAAGKELYQKIETAWLNATGNQEQLRASKVMRDTSKLAYELSLKKYEFGGLTTTELLVSENTYLNAEREYLQVKYMGKLYEQLLGFYQGNELSL